LRATRKNPFKTDYLWVVIEEKGTNRTQREERSGVGLESNTSTSGLNEGETQMTNMKFVKRKGARNVYRWWVRKFDRYHGLVRRGLRQKSPKGGEDGLAKKTGQTVFRGDRHVASASPSMGEQTKKKPHHKNQSFGSQRNRNVRGKHPLMREKVALMVGKVVTTGDQKNKKKNLKGSVGRCESILASGSGGVLREPSVPEGKLGSGRDCVRGERKRVSTPTGEQSEKASKKKKKKKKKQEGTKLRE